MAKNNQLYLTFCLILSISAVFFLGVLSLVALVNPISLHLDTKNSKQTEISQFSLIFAALFYLILAIVLQCLISKNKKEHPQEGIALQNYPQYEGDEQLDKLKCD